MKLWFTIIKKDNDVDAPFEILENDACLPPTQDRSEANVRVCTCEVTVPRNSEYVLDVLRSLEDIGEARMILEDACSAPWLETDDIERRSVPPYTCVIFSRSPTKTYCSIMPTSSSISEGDCSMLWKAPLMIMDRQGRTFEALCLHPTIRKELLALLEEIVLQSYLAKTRAPVAA